MKIATFLAASMLSLGSAYAMSGMNVANYEDANVFAGRQASVDAKVETHLANYEDANVFAGRMASAEDRTSIQYVNYENDGHVASANGSTGGPSGSPDQYACLMHADEGHVASYVPEGNGHVDIA